MKRSVLLNWLPFENTATGAAKRAIELHSRLGGEFSLTAAVTSGFPTGTAPSVRKTVVAPGRNLAVRFSERLPGFWRKAGVSDIWVTDTLPVPAFGSRIRTVLTVHDLRFLVNRKYLSLPRYLLLKLNMKAGLGRADAVVTVSSWIADQIVENYGISRSKLHIVANSAASLPEVQPSADRKYILSVGHLERRKSLHTLILAFAAVAGKWDGDLVIAGRGGLESELRSLSGRLNLGSRVNFTGGVSDKELAGLYAGATCLVCPSVYEGFGMTVLEGLSAGIPVVASAIPPHREVAGDAATWFEPGNTDDLSRVLEQLLSGGVEDNSEMRAHRVKMFNWDDSAEELASIYRQL
ncbi:MAG: hypothetical protein B1H09_02895 [Gemmatimonadaceae bacterium 4484_173]|nr:MAG: hypothetical protein B1H09_02895 [Gemmatimonadaceae bacterium 4484_173]